MRVYKVRVRETYHNVVYAEVYFNIGSFTKVVWNSLYFNSYGPYSYVENDINCAFRIARWLNRTNDKRV